MRSGVVFEEQYASWWRGPERQQSMAMPGVVQAPCSCGVAMQNSGNFARST